MKKATVKLPKLKTKDELLEASPELQKLLGVDDDDGSALVMAPPPKSAGKPGAKLLGGQARNDKAMLANGEMVEELTEEEIIEMELQKVKSERAMLLAQIAQAKTEAGTAGGELQQNDIRYLHKELELKKAKLNELREEARRKNKSLAVMEDQQVDARRLTPTALTEETDYIQQLKDEMGRLDEDLLEAEAKNRLYTLLGERTKREHVHMDLKVRAAQKAKKDSMDDYRTLTNHLQDQRAQREAAEKELARMKAMYEETKNDWKKKLRERRREVSELKKRQEKQKKRDQLARERQTQKEQQEKEARLRLALEQEQFEMRVAALAPKVEAMEASWNRIRAVSGADTPEEVIAYWSGLKSKEEAMRRLVRMAEAREADAKAEIARLLEVRASTFEKGDAKPEATEVISDEQTKRIEAAERRMEMAKERFDKLRDVCIAAEQGLRSLQERLMVALEEVTVSDLRSSLHRHSEGGTKSGRSNRNTPTQRSRTHGLITPDRKGRSHKGAGGGGIITPSESTVLSAEGSTVSMGGSDKPQNTIDDEHFFPQLPDTLAQVADRMNKLLYKVNGPTAPPAARSPERLPESEVALMKGMDRKTWTGGPFVQQIAEAENLASGVLPSSLKRKKGKKKEQQVQPDLNRILGYTGEDVDLEPEPEEEDEEDEEEWDGVLDRDYIKMRAAKMAQRHAALAAAQGAK